MEPTETTANGNFIWGRLEICGTDKEPQHDLEKTLGRYAAVSRADCKLEYT